MRKKEGRKVKLFCEGESLSLTAVERGIGEEERWVEKGECTKDGKL